jgi:glycosyltransferase involved in cell wall biosynthesis
MIVRNEGHVLARCFDSLKHLISCWHISDTGSTDDTREVIMHELAGIPGCLYQDRWVDFSHNRNLVLERARGSADWLIMHDADETLEGDFSGLNPAADGHALYLFAGAARSAMVRIYRGDQEWRYEGAMHEHPVLDGKNMSFLRTLRNYSHRDGARSKDPNTAMNDAAILSQMPLTARNLFNLAQSYKDAGAIDEAIAAFLRSAEIDEFKEEAWLARYIAAELCMTARPEEAAARMVRCVEEDPRRAEPFYCLALMHRDKNPAFALSYASRAARMPVPKRLLAVDMDIHKWKAAELAYQLAWKLDDFEEMRWCLEKVCRNAPIEVCGRAEENLGILAEHLEALNELRKQ